MSDGSFFSELRKRKVVQAAAIYGAVAWGVTEVLVTIVEQLFLPQWVSTLAVIFFVVGFPVAMFLSWTFDLTAEGIQRTTITSRRGRASIVVSMMMLVAGTAVMFFLIKPALQVRDTINTPVSIAPNSIAVLPFVNAGAVREDGYIIGGLSDELRYQLSQLPTLRVAARSSSVAAVRQDLDARAAAEKLGVSSILEGNVRRRGNTLRVSVQLIGGSDGLTAWSETFERSPNELLNLQLAIVESVAAHLLPDLNVVVEPATRDVNANELMLLALNYEQIARERHEGYEENLLEAVWRYREATEADPEFTLAFSRLAGAQIYLGNLEAAEAPIFKALSLSPNLSEVQNTLGEYYWARGLVTEAGAAWAKAVELNPNNPEALPNYATFLWKKTRVSEAKELNERALDLDRLNLERYAQLGSFLALQNFREEAFALVLQIEELFSGPAAFRVIADLRSYLGEVDKAIAWAIKARDLEPDNFAHIEKLAQFYADIGDFETALRLNPDAIGTLFKMRRFEEVIDLAEFEVIEEPDDLGLLRVLTMAYNAVGQYQSTIYLLGTWGLPKTIRDGARNTEEVDAFIAFLNAVYAVGDMDLARDMAQIAVDYGKWETVYWWINIPAACELAILGRDDEARAFLELAGQDQSPAWDPFLKDLPCFDRFKDDPVYQATIQHHENLRAMLLKRLPATLAEFGVKL